jgi:hypothetical protein
MWIVGGYNIALAGTGNEILKDIWYSTTGTAWTQATAAAPFSRRMGFGLEVFDGKMWMFGGYSDTLKNDVWYSTDGVNWTRTTASAAWSATSIYGCLHNDKIIFANGITAREAWSSDMSVFVLAEDVLMTDAARVDAESGGVYGIKIGTGDEDFSGGDAEMIEAIADGDSSGEMTYGDMRDAGRLSEPSVVGADNIMRIERDFENNSGGSITIKEIGLSCRGIEGEGLFLLRAQVNKAVLDGASVRVAIELLTTV